MSFVKIDKNNFEHVSLNIKPSVHFVSSSIGQGVTGSSFVAPSRSKCLKELIPINFDLNSNVATTTLGSSLSSLFTSPVASLGAVKAKETSYGSLNSYLSSVNAASNISKFSKTIDVFRFDQPLLFNKNRNIKNIVKNVFMPYHKHRYDHCNFTYTNYNTLNFFNSQTIPTGSALIYPNIEGDTGGVYDLPNNFSINFWINPRYTNTGEYHAGTVLHLSSSIAISLVSGSSRNEFGQPDNFKILLQLSQSADTKPSSINLASPSGVYPNNLIFTSSHALQKNSWHHVCVQWGQNYNNSSGSIFIDENETNFYVPSASLSANQDNSPSGLVVGNYYDGNVNNLSYILNNASASLEGFTGVIPASAGDPTINADTFSHPLNAEVHEVKIYNKTLNTKGLHESEFLANMRRGPENFNNLIFYVPPFFYPSSSVREVLTSPFQTVTSTTDDPFNVAFSFGTGGKLINLENFTREFVVGQQPRHIGLFPDTIDTTIEDITSDQFVYNTGSHKKRNMTILPNDNGLFTPKYYALSSSPMSASSKFYENNDFETSAPDYTIVSLENLIPSSSLFPGLVQSTGSLFDAVVSASANNPGVQQGAVLTVAQRTKDVSSNEIVIYDISNIYYGNRIHPGSFQIYDSDLTGSDGKIKITLKDNERGSLYRADSNTAHAKWNSVGNVLYDEGIAIIKSPHLMYLSKDKTDISFKGEQNIHTMILNVPAYKEMFTSSSNPTFTPITPSTGANDENLKSLYITTVNIHDNNFNIIMKANFAQPIIKTEEDEFVIRLKEDF